MDGKERRQEIVSLIKNTPDPLSGSFLAKTLGVSRQVVVQDIALLRTQGYPILATPRGYVFSAQDTPVRLIKVLHTNQETEDELNTIVDLGGTVVDVLVNHRIYGKVSAPLNIKSRRDVRLFLDDIQSGHSVPLMNVTSGYHFHHISAETEAILDEITAALSEKHFLAEFTSYEKETM